tara:strand:+ start:45202 stop:46980 length:1779 start_codon:yes stop_codon:yes gene_type:complete
MNKLILTILLFSISIFSFGQIEIILEAGNPATFESALSDIGANRGTITIKRKVIVSSSTTVPENITLNFFNGGMLSMSTTLALNIEGNIISPLNPIFEFTLGFPPNHNLTIKNKNQPIYPEWFGTCTYQDSSITDDKNTIQKAINAMEPGGEIVFKGNYVVSGPVNITLNEAAIRIKGIGVYMYGDSNNDTNYIKNNNSGMDSPIFNISAYGIRLSDLNFRGKIEGTNKGSGATGRALTFVRANGSKDLDAAISNCKFVDFRTAIYGEGANLKITDNTFTASYMGIHIKEAQDNSSLEKGQTRGHIILRNRFHSMGGFLNDSSLIGSSCVKIIHDAGYTEDSSPQLKYYVYGYYNQISNNYADDCKTFFEGSLDRTIINGNSILGSADTAIKAFAGNYGVISNNIIDGSHTWNPHKLFDYAEIGAGSGDSFPQGHGIHVRYSHRLNINNNTITNKRYHGIYIERSINTTIQSNTIMNFNRHAYVRPEINGQKQTISTIDLKRYDGIHIDCTELVAPENSHRYNIQNIVVNNIISFPFNPLGGTNSVGRYGIFVGDGDSYGFVKDNFIVSARLVQPILIESPTGVCSSISEDN